MSEFWNKVNKAILGGITVVVTLILNYLGWCFGPKASVPMWVVWLILISCYAICVLVYAFASKDIKTVYILPRVKAIRNNDGKIVFLLEKNDLFMQGSFVTIAYQDEDDEIEVILGLGYVETINSQGNMQIVFQSTVSNNQADDIVNKLSNDKHYRNAIKIKPSVSKNSIREDLNSWETF